LERGFVYGFSIELSAASCGDARADIREYASRGHRDEAAHTLASAGETALVLGRWAIALHGDDPAALDRLSARFQTIGAVPVTA
jgi:hypothetical protein